MHVIVYSPSSDEVFLERELDGEEIMDERTFADQVAAEHDMAISEPDGYIPSCSGDLRVEFRPDPACPWHIWSGESFYFKEE